MRLVLALVILAGCGNGNGPQCGAAADAAASGLSGTVSGDVIPYGGFTSSENNDCPAGGGVISVTLEARQTGACGANCGFFNLCLPRPDLLDGDAVSLGDADLVRVDTLSGQVGLCQTLRSDRAAPTGTVRFTGFCTTAGTHWVLAIDGSVPVARTCGMGPTVETDLALQGQADVVSL